MAKQSHNGGERARLEQEIQRTFGFVPEFYDAIPDATFESAWRLHRDFELPADTALDNKTKELIGLAIAAHIKCAYCIYFHSKAARAHGASDEEMKEALAMSGLTVSFSNMISGMRVDLDQFRRDVDRAVDYMLQQGGPQPSAP